MTIKNDVTTTCYLHLWKNQTEPMLKLLTRLATALAMLYIPSVLKSQCDATFSYIATASTTYHFASNQQLQTGLTYYHTWKVGNNTIATTTNTDYTFPAQGNYLVCHKVNIQDANANTVCTDSSCIYLQITTQPPCFPQVNVNANSLSFYDFHFSNTLADYTDVDVRWTFGDGNSISGVASPIHHYNQLGWYTACLYLTDTVAYCSDTFCVGVHVDTLAVNPCPLNAFFKTNQPAYNTPTLALTDNSSGTYHTASWNYGDGSTSTSFQPTHQFPAFGVYNVCLTITDTITGCNKSFCKSVLLDSCNTNFAEFTASNNWASNTIHFDPQKLDVLNTLTWHWEFGDSTYDFSHKTVNHTYATTDTFTACLYVTAFGCQQVSICKPVVPRCNVYASYTAVMVGPNTTQFNSQSSGSNLTYTWIFGDSTVGDEQHPVHVYAQSGFYTACLVARDSMYGCTDTVCNTLYVTSQTDTICGNLFVDYNLNGVQDTLEPPLVGANILCTPSGAIFTTDNNGHYEGLVPWDPFAGVLTIKLLYGGVHINTLPLGSDEYTYNFILPNQKQCGFDFGVVTATARIAGTVFGDYNQNGNMDFNEKGIPNQLIHAGNQIAVTGSDGNYLLVVPLGQYNVWRDSSGYYAGLPWAPVSHTINAFTPGGLYSNNNFGIGMSSTYQDVAVDLIPTTPVALAYRSYYHILATNLGSYTSYVEQGMAADALLNFDSLATGAFTYTVSTNNVAWGALLGGFQQSVQTASFNPDISVVVNQNIYNTGFVNLLFGTDGNPSNNIDSVHQVVVASFDPNNKLSDAGEGSNGYIRNSEKIKFVVNFENTGNYLAMNVVIKDVIGPEFDLSTFRYVGSSHKEVCDVRLDGNTVYFRFSEIHLPFNKPESQGWVSFEITPKQNLIPGSQLQNTAAIYFDHNEPVITNTTLHTIGEPLSIANFDNNHSVMIAPNPFSEKTLFKIEGVNENYNFDLYNVSGIRERHVTDIQQPTFELERNELAPGMYFYRITSKSGVELQGKLVLQ